MRQHIEAPTGRPYVWRAGIIMSIGRVRIRAAPLGLHIIVVGPVTQTDGLG